MSERLADRNALLELKARYFRYLDTKQWDEWRRLFTDDMVFFGDQGPVPESTEPIVTGADNFVAMVSGMLAGAVTVHHGHMPEITFTGQHTATGIWAMFDRVDNPLVPDVGDEDLQVEFADGWTGYGHYHERYEQGDDGEWRIAEVRLTRLRHDPAEAARGAADANTSAREGRRR